MMDSIERQLRFPDFLCIGTQKSGTTWLYENLRHHPMIWMPRVKELQYFNGIYVPGQQKWARSFRQGRATNILTRHVFINEGRTVDWTLVAELTHLSGEALSDTWYGETFRFAPPEKIAGEVTPDYCLLPDEGIDHILDLKPDAKAIFIVRDMIDRVWSQVRMIATIQGGRSSPEELGKIAILPEVLARSDYNGILDRWTRKWDRQRFLLINYDDIGSRPEKVLNEITSFLGVSFADLPTRDARRKIHTGEPSEIPPEIYGLLKDKLRALYEVPHPMLSDIVPAWRARHYG